jgi:pimeloyl-ACP methyl ester carboxylesterase
MHACEPRDDGFVERQGVKIHYEVYGDGRPTIVLLPTWAIIHKRFWKLQLAYLSRHYRVVSFDGRGNGRSDRPSGVEAYLVDEYAADTLAVLDATGTERAVLVASSCGSLWGTIVAADHPERVDGIVHIGPAVGLAPGHPERQVYRFNKELETADGWAKYNLHHWRRDYRDFLEFFFTQAFSEPHSTKQIEDCVEWGLEIDPETLASTHWATRLCRSERFLEICVRVRCPVLVIHGNRDRLRPHAQGAALAAATSAGTLVTVEGGGHFPMTRDPVRVNLLIKQFVDRVGR